jgi:hypothetical protein
VNIRLKQVAERIVNHPVPLHPVHAGESLGDYCNDKVAFSVPGARMTNVQLTLILDR